MIYILIRVMMVENMVVFLFRFVNLVYMLEKLIVFGGIVKFLLKDVK